jgi:hypothetical protein
MSLLYLVYCGEKSQLTETWEMQEICLWTTRLEQEGNSMAVAFWILVFVLQALQVEPKSVLEESSQMCRVHSLIWRFVLVFIGKSYIFSKLCNMKPEILKYLVATPKILSSCIYCHVSAIPPSYTIYLTNVCPCLPGECNYNS